MLDKNVNEKAINDTYKNARLAMQSISDILPKVEDKSLKKEIEEQNAGYEKLAQKMAQYMKKHKIETSEVGMFKKVMMKGSISMKTMMNNSRNNIADMMIKGTLMGINELTAMKNEKENFDEEVAAFIEELLNLEESFQEKLKKYL